MNNVRVPLFAVQTIPRLFGESTRLVTPSFKHNHLDKYSSVKYLGLEEPSSFTKPLVFEIH